MSVVSAGDRGPSRVRLWWLRLLREQVPIEAQVHASGQRADAVTKRADKALARRMEILRAEARASKL